MVQIVILYNFLTDIAIIYYYFEHTSLGILKLII